MSSLQHPRATATRTTHRRRATGLGLGLVPLLAVVAAAPSAAAATRIVRVDTACADARAALVVDLGRPTTGDAAATIAVFRGTGGRGRRIGGARVRISGPRERVRVRLPATALGDDCGLPADEPLVVTVRIREGAGPARVLRRELRAEPTRASEIQTADAPTVDAPAEAAPAAPAPASGSVPPAPAVWAPAPVPDPPAPARAEATRSRQAGLVPTPVVEASGLVVGRTNPEHRWTLNDSGGASALYAVAADGRVAATLAIPGVANVDWEDLAAAGAAPSGDLYIADIGDNAARRASIRVHRVREPSLVGVPDGATITAGAVDSVTLTYPDGARDAEALIVDQATRDLYVITKREARSRVYRAVAPPFATGGSAVLELVGELPIGGVVAADVCPDNATVLVKTYAAILAYSDPAGIVAALRGPGAARRYDGEPQGEAIAAAADCRGYATLSENVPRATPQPLVVYDGG